MLIGTSHFPSVQWARAYYGSQGEGAAAVREKIAEGSIHIGKPTAKPGEHVVLIDGGARYAIEDGKK